MEIFNEDRLVKSMTNIRPSEDQIKRIEDLRESYKSIVLSLAGNCNNSRELNIATEKLEESLMWAVKSIVLE